jgi:hypothetical protein
MIIEFAIDDLAVVSPALMLIAIYGSKAWWFL